MAKHNPAAFLFGALLLLSGVNAACDPSDGWCRADDAMISRNWLLIILMSICGAVAVLLRDNRRVAMSVLVWGGSTCGLFLFKSIFIWYLIVTVDIGWYFLGKKTTEQWAKRSSSKATEATISDDEGAGEDSVGGEEEADASK